jgi:urate oxidase
MIDGLAKLEEQAKFTEVASSAKAITMDLFATDESASVQVGLSPHAIRRVILMALLAPQATVYKMCQEIIAKNPTVGSVTYRLPNKHYIPVNLAFMKLENMTPPEKCDVFTPVESPR